MTTTSRIDRQPSKLDYASPTQFKFSILKLPKVEFFGTSVNLPGINLNTTTQQTPLKDIPVPGEKLTFADLEMSFMVDENLENYREIHGWLTGIGFPRDTKQFTELSKSGKDRFPIQGKDTTLTVPGDGARLKEGDTAVPLGPVFSDATLNILTSKNNANIEVRFQNVFPMSLSGLNFNQQAEDVDYLSATVVFKYTIYEFATKGASRTTETVS
tara:strand:+ start:112 stop:753 length:642 start_codon:yes stop_codon:yes gene_type:complete